MGRALLACAGAPKQNCTWAEHTNNGLQMMGRMQLVACLFSRLIPKPWISDGAGFLVLGMSFQMIRHQAGSPLACVGFPKCKQQGWQLKNALAKVRPTEFYISTWGTDRPHQIGVVQKGSLHGSGREAQQRVAADSSLTCRQTASAVERPGWHSFPITLDPSITCKIACSTSWYFYSPSPSLPHGDIKILEKKQIILFDPQLILTADLVML